MNIIYILKYEDSNGTMSAGRYDSVDEANSEMYQKLQTVRELSKDERPELQVVKFVPNVMAEFVSGDTRKTWKIEIQVPDNKQKKNTEILRMAAPYWSEEKNGVVIPLLDIVLDAKNASKTQKKWNDARPILESLNHRMFTKDEAYILLWQKDEINAILKEHNGELMDGFYWTDEYEPYESKVWVAYISPRSSDLLMRIPTRYETVRGVRDL